MRGFLEKRVTDERTNGRTDERTNGGELIGPISASGRGPKRAKTAKTRFFPELSVVFFKSKPKMQFKYAKLRRSYDQISKN